MNFLLDFLTLALILLSAFLALRVRDLISAAVVMSVYSFLMCLLWAEMGAVDVSFTEAAVGSGVSTVFIIATIFKTTRRTSD